MDTTSSSAVHSVPVTVPGDIPRAGAASERALVLSGGGSAGNAWLIGVIAGLCDAGLDVTEADLLIGTSAGSTAAAQVTSARPAALLAHLLAGIPPVWMTGKRTSATSLMLSGFRSVYVEYIC